MGLKATKLTEEQERYWKTLLIRAVDANHGQPALAYLFFQMTPFNVPGMKTMGLDARLRVYVDFDYFMYEKGDIEYASGVLNHEPWHFLRRHHERFKTLDTRTDNKAHNHMAWNHAGDLAINEALGKQSQGGKVPDDGLFPGSEPYRDYKEGQTTEAYYDLIMKSLPDVCPDCGQPTDKKDEDKKDSSDQNKGDKQGDQDGQQGDQDGQQGDQQGGDQQGDQNGQDDNGGQQGQDGQGQGDQQGGQDGNGGQQGQGGQNGTQPGGQGGQPGGDQQGNGGGQGDSDGHTCSGCGQDRNGGQGGLNGSPVNCGSGAGNKSGEWELGDEDESGVDAEKADQIRKKVAQDVKRLAQSQPGKVPGAMALWADEELAATPLDWRKVLRGAIRSASNAWARGKMDYNRRRPNRRQPVRDVVFPALMMPRPRIGVAIDTSGSHLHKLGVVVDQVTEITKQMGTRGRDLLAFGVDVRMTDVKPVNNPRLLLDDMTGGGGTDMRVGIKQLHQLRMEKKIDIAIMLTDLQTDWPKERPNDGMKYVIVGICDSSNQWEMEWAARAEEAIGSWADVVIVDVNHNG